MHNPSRSNTCEQCELSTFARAGSCIAHWLHVGLPGRLLVCGLGIHRPAVLLVLNFAWQRHVQAVAAASAKGKLCNAKRQAMQAQKASNASPKGRLCKPERQAMQAKPYLRFVLQVECLLLFSSLRCCTGGCPLALLIRPILAACTTCILQEADVNSMHACAVPQKLTACFWPILSTVYVCGGVCVTQRGLWCVVAAEPCDISCDEAGAPL